MELRSKAMSNGMAKQGYETQWQGKEERRAAQLWQRREVHSGAVAEKCIDSVTVH